MKRYRFEAVKVERNYLFRFKETLEFINNSNFLIKKEDFIKILNSFENTLKPYLKKNEKDIFSLKIEIKSQKDIELQNISKKDLEDFVLQVRKKGKDVTIDRRYINDEFVDDFDLEEFLGFFLIEKDTYLSVKKEIENCKDCIIVSMGAFPSYFKLTILNPQKTLKKIEEEFDLPNSFKIIDITPDIRFYYPTESQEVKEDVILGLQKEIEKIKNVLIEKGIEEDEAEKQAFDIYREKREFKTKKAKIKQKLLKGVPMAVTLSPYYLFYNLVDTVTIPLEFELEKGIIPIYLLIKLRGQVIWNSKINYFINKDRYIDVEDVKIYTKKENRYIDITDLFKPEEGTTFKGGAAWRLFDYYMVINDNLYKKSKKIKIIIDNEWKEKIAKQINFEFLNLKVSPTILKEKINERFNKNSIDKLPHEYKCSLKKLDYRYDFTFSENGQDYLASLVFILEFDETSDLEKHKVGVAVLCKEIETSKSFDDISECFDMEKLVSLLDIDVLISTIMLEKTQIKFEFCEEFLEKCKIKNLMEVLNNE